MINAGKTSFSRRQAFSPIYFSWKMAARGNDRFWHICDMPARSDDVR
jgi:hypothetical protein